MVHFTPLRYPGGKGKLAAYVKAIIDANKLYDGEYVEPYAGGAAIGLELLFQEYVTRIHINDLSGPVYSLSLLLDINPRLQTGRGFSRFVHRLSP